MIQSLKLSATPACPNAINPSHVAAKAKSITTGTVITARTRYVDLRIWMDYRDSRLVLRPVSVAIIGFPK